MIAVRYEGLRELAQALRATNYELYTAVVAGLRQAGEAIRTDARSRFVEYGTQDDRTPRSLDGYLKAADGFRTLVRPNTSTMAIVSVGQTLRSTTYQPRRRPNFGDLMMRHALLPARNEKLAEAAAIVETEVSGLLARNGF